MYRLVPVSATLKDRCLDLPLWAGSNAGTQQKPPGGLVICWPRDNSTASDSFATRLGLHSSTPLPSPFPSLVLLFPAKSPEKQRRLEKDSSETSWQFVCEAVRNAAKPTSDMLGPYADSIRCRHPPKVAVYGHPPALLFHWHLTVDS